VYTDLAHVYDSIERGECMLVWIMYMIV